MAIPARGYESAQEDGMSLHLACFQGFLDTSHGCDNLNLGLGFPCLHTHACPYFFQNKSGHKLGGCKELCVAFSTITGNHQVLTVCWKKYQGLFPGKQINGFICKEGITQSPRERKRRSQDSRPGRVGSSACLNGRSTLFHGQRPL